jgi:hypothetical protein
MGSEVHIGRLRVRVPGLSRDEAGRVAADAVQRVADRLPPDGATRHLGRVTLRVPVAAGSSRETVVAAVARAIGEALR